MSFFWILFVILILYARQHRWCCMIDDHVHRSRVLVELTENKPSYEYYDQPKPLRWTIENLVIFIAVCGYIYHLWGWQASLLYAVFPLNTQSAVWGRTGSIYSATVLLVLASVTYYLYGTYWGIGIAALFYLSAVHQGVSALPLAFWITLSWPQGGAGLVMLIPLILFFTSKRWKVGWRRRVQGHEDVGIEGGKFRAGRLFLMPKVVAYYIFMALTVPIAKLGFFHEFGYDEANRGELIKPTFRFYTGILLIIMFIIWGILVDWRMMLWSLLFIGVYSQYVTLGQFVCERYTSLFNVGFCVLMGQTLATHPYLLTILATVWACRAWEYAPAYRHNKHLFGYGIAQQPAACENWNNMGNFYSERGRHYEALRNWLVAHKKGMIDDYKLLCNIGNTYARLGKFKESKEWLLKTRCIAPKKFIEDTLDPQLHQLDEMIYKQEIKDRIKL